MARGLDEGATVARLSVFAMLSLALLLLWALTTTEYETVHLVSFEQGPEGKDDLQSQVSPSGTSSRPSVIAADPEVLRHFPISEREAVAQRMGQTLRARVAAQDRWLNIAFIGDSLTRYQYLSLANYAKGGKYIPNEVRPNPMLEKTFRSWKTFYGYTNRLLQPYEVCDCNRPDRWNVAMVYENRYYLDSKARISLTYIQAFGDAHIHGHFAAEDIHKANFTIADVSNPRTHRLLPPKWTYDWPSALAYISKLQPRPTHVLMNAGYWRNSFGNPAFRQRVISAAKKFGFVVIWKTTNFGNRHRLDRRVIDADRAMCQLADICLDLEWTIKVDPKLYWDDKHFYPVIYQAINEHMLSLLKIL